jgi:hypothetical protein
MLVPEQRGDLPEECFRDEPRRLRRRRYAADHSTAFEGFPNVLEVVEEVKHIGVKHNASAGQVTLVVCGLGSKAGSCPRTAARGRVETGTRVGPGGAHAPGFNFGKRLPRASVSSSSCWGHAAQAGFPKVIFFC